MRSCSFCRAALPRLRKASEFLHIQVQQLLWPVLLIAQTAGVPSIGASLPRAAVLQAQATTLREWPPPALSNALQGQALVLAKTQDTLNWGESFYPSTPLGLAGQSTDTPCGQWLVGPRR